MAPRNSGPPRLFGMEISWGTVLTILTLTVGIITTFNTLQFRIEAIAKDLETAKTESKGYVSQVQFQEFKDQLWQRLDRIERNTEK